MLDTDEMRAALRGKLVVSVAAGVRLEQIRRWLPESPLIRAMPNTPALIGEGMTVVSRGPLATDAHVHTAIRLFQAVGRCLELEEKSMDVVTALNSSGPAFAYLIIEALAEGGVMMGLRRDVAMEIAAQMLQGSARMVLQTGHAPGGAQGPGDDAGRAAPSPGCSPWRTGESARSSPEQSRRRPGWPHVWGSRSPAHFRPKSRRRLERSSISAESLARPLPGRPGRCQDLLPWDCSTANASPS